MLRPCKLESASFTHRSSPFELCSNRPNHCSSPFERRPPARKPASVAAISTRPPKNTHFYKVFCDFPLRSLNSLAIVLGGPGFPRKTWGSGLAACLDRIGVERKIRRISRLDGSQANEQDQDRVAHRRETQHIEENRRSIL